MNTKTIRTTLAMTVASLVASVATADIIAKYDFNSSSFANSAIASGVSASVLSPGNKIKNADGFSSYSSEGASSYYSGFTAIYTGQASTTDAFTATA